jgi:lysine 2,3-aminomutase
MGTEHFRTSVQIGLEIIGALRGHTSGLAVPHYVIDAPGGGGKIAIIPDPIVSFDDNEIILKNYEGNVYRYPIPL